MEREEPARKREEEGGATAEGGVSVMMMLLVVVESVLCSFGVDGNKESEREGERGERGSFGLMLLPSSASFCPAKTTRHGPPPPLTTTTTVLPTTIARSTAPIAINGGVFETKTPHR